MINETLYCERLMYLEWAQNEFADNAFTVDGRAVHARADQPGGALPPLADPSREEAPAKGSTSRTASTEGEGDEDDDGPPPNEARSWEPAI